MDYEEKQWILINICGKTSHSEAPAPADETAHSKMPEPPSKQQRFDFSETIVICAGEEQKEFQVHKNVLSTSSSRFLNRMLSNDWKETREKRLLFPDTRPEILEVYLHWIYTGNIILEPTSADTETVRRVELYILGDYLDDLSFCEAIIEELAELSHRPGHQLPSVAAVSLAWSKTSMDSPLRAVIKELFLGVAIDSTVKSFVNNDDFQYEFILDLFTGLVDYNPAFCKRSISHKTDKQIQASCIGFFRKAFGKRSASSISTQKAVANDA